MVGKRPDKYPPAIAKEGGANANVRLIDAVGNQAAMVSIGRQFNAPVRQPDGTHSAKDVCFCGESRELHLLSPFAPWLRISSQ